LSVIWRRRASATFACPTDVVVSIASSSFSPSTTMTLPKPRPGVLKFQSLIPFGGGRKIVQPRTIWGAFSRMDWMPVPERLVILKDNEGWFGRAPQES
jgi:hypothetical protein